MDSPPLEHRRIKETTSCQGSRDHRDQVSKNDVSGILNLNQHLTVEVPTTREYLFSLELGFKKQFLSCGHKTLPRLR